MSPRVLLGAVGDAPIVLRPVPHEDLAEVALPGTATDDFVDSGRRGLTCRAGVEEPGGIIALRDREARQVQPAVAIEARERLVARSQQIQRRVRRDPEVLV